VSIAAAASNRIEPVRLVFEAFAAGPFTAVECQGGRLENVSGKSEIISHVRAGGGKALALRGSESTVQLTFPGVIKGHITEIAFNAERWTGRSPFHFSVEAQIGDE
jgi:hypothetical protein